MEKQQSPKFSGKSDVYQQGAYGENWSDVSTPSVQPTGSKDQNDKKMPMFVRDMNIKDEPMGTRAPGSPGGKSKDGSVLKATDALKSRIKEETITIYVRGPGNQKKPLRISTNELVDDIRSAANAAFGFGHTPSNTNTYIIHSDKELVNGTGQTAAQAGIHNQDTLDLCVRTLGGQNVR